ncbi:SGNH/GDSL hydrolase family protein [Methylocystis sp. JAN1]|uniref:SGNH/GDSL hydrolase family protein n=1 Tax=Methylocystis sp. JAN1 TaxID=3397211 RepID=UPI003FA28986
MRVMILGGSNSGPKTGWAAILREIAGEHVIENRFLGAVGSLFGLLRLLKMIRDGQPRPDAVIFEYTLNDTVWMAGDSLEPETVVETLHDVMTICARERIRLLFLCLCLRPRDGGGEAEGSLFLDRLYREAARARGVATLFLSDVLGKIDPGFFVDPKHLDAAASRRVAEAVAARLQAPLPVPNDAGRKLSFAYLDASQASLSSKAWRLDHKSTVFDGPLIKLPRGGKCAFDTDGRLAALLIRSTETSGAYSIHAGGRTIRKNAQSLARQDAPNLIALHYVTAELPQAPQVVVEMTASEIALMAQSYDLTLMDGPPHVPFNDQTLEIAGIMVHRRRSLLERALARLVAC